MTSCSLTRIERLLRVQVAGEGNEPFYLTFAISPHISLLSKSIIPNASRRSTIPITPSLPPSIRGLPPCSRMPRDAVQAPDAESREMLGIMPLQASPQPQGPCPDTTV